METKFLNLFKLTLEITDYDIKMEDEFRTYPEWDSLAYLSIIAMLDKEYEIQIEEAEFNKIITLNDLYNAIKR